MTMISIPVEAASTALDALNTWLDTIDRGLVKDPDDLTEAIDEAIGVIRSALDAALDAARAAKPSTQN